jgi:hypothetical protein
MVLDDMLLNESPLDRFSRISRPSEVPFWHTHTWHVDGDGIKIIRVNPNNRARCMQPQVYVDTVNLQ